MHGKAVSLTGRYPGYKDLEVVLLPTSDTKVSVWKFYLECCEADHVVGMKYSTFCQKWQELTPYIIIMKPRSNLCWTCQSTHEQILNSSNQTIEEKTARIQSQVEHLEHANNERKLYNNLCLQAKETTELLGSPGNLTLLPTYFQNTCM